MLRAIYLFDTTSFYRSERYKSEYKNVCKKSFLKLFLTTQSCLSLNVTCSWKVLIEQTLEFVLAVL
jgi:hypothetical protein